MLTLCAATEGRRRARDRGGGRGLTKVPVLLYGLFNSPGKRCCLSHTVAGFYGSENPPYDCVLQHMQQESSQVVLGELECPKT